MKTILLPLQALVSALSNRRRCHSTRLRVRFVPVFALCLTAIGGLTIASPPGQSAESQTGSQSVSAVSSSTTAPIAPQFFTPAEQAAIANALIGLGFLLPIGLGLGIFLSDRYTHYRATLLKQHIETLERIWQESNMQR